MLIDANRAVNMSFDSDHLAQEVMELALPLSRLISDSQVYPFSAVEQHEAASALERILQESKYLQPYLDPLTEITDALDLLGVRWDVLRETVR